VWALALAGTAHAGLEPVGSDFQIAGETSGYAYAPRVDMDPAGGFVVVWQYFDPAAGENEWDVRARRFDAEGAALGDDFIVNEFTTGFQESPAVAMSRNAEFIVTWSGLGEGEPDGAFARMFAADGTPKAPELRLHDESEDVYEHFTAVTASERDFVVSWLRQDAVVGARLDADGNQVAEFAIEEYMPRRVAVSALPGGEFVVVWSTKQYVGGGVFGGDVGYVRGRSFAADGTAGDDFQANSGRDDPSGYGFVVDGISALSVAANATGQFVVGFDSYVPHYFYNVDEPVDGYDLGAKIERFAGQTSEGAELVSEQDTGVGYQIGSDVAMTPGGNAIAVWSDDALAPRAIQPDTPDTDSDGIFARAIDCHGDDLTPGAIQVNAYTTGGQRRPSAAINEAGDIVVVWQTPREDGNGFAVVGRRFALTGGCALCGDADANGRVTATDALVALQTGIGLATCALDRCDIDGSATITATDALRILTAAVEDGPPSLACAVATAGPATAPRR
jgi:hypothetical protein